MDGICDRVIVGGVAVGGSLALSLASRIKEVAGVFAICPPRTLKDYSTKFMPTLDVWDRMLNRLKGEGEQQFLDFTYGNSHVNYGKNPVAGVHQVGEFLDSMKKNYGAISQPALIIQADENPVVDPAGAQTIYEKLGSREKEYCLLSFNRHVLVEGEDSNRVHRRISDFIEMI
jgi:esterase/lipase